MNTVKPRRPAAALWESPWTQEQQEAVKREAERRSNELDAADRLALPAVMEDLSTSDQSNR